MSYDQLATFLAVADRLAAMDDDTRPEAAPTLTKRDALVFLTLADAGLRPGEALALRWEDIDVAGRLVHVERAVSGGIVKATKTEETRFIDLSRRLADALDRWQAQAEADALVDGRDVSLWVFPSRTGEPLEVRSLAKRFRAVLRAAKLPKSRLYDLRHTYATQLLESGAPITYVADQLGHTKPTTTLTYYAHWLPRGDRVLIDRLIDARSAANATVPADLWHQVGTNFDDRGNELAQVREILGEPSGTRTQDPLIKSQVLCHLS